ncbi:MAG: tyrosine recombinase [Alphaproteobacteria bacterium]|nr:tyrosine recombinase [Alphaproteobacteria bacterium]
MQTKIVQNFLDMMVAEKGASINTVSAYEYDLTQFFEIIDTSPAKITRKHITDYINEISSMCYAQKSQARKLSVIREFCKFLLQEKILTDNPSQNLSAPKQEKNLPNFLTDSQIKLLIKTAQQQKNRSLKRIAVMISLMYATGLRVSELICLTQNSINFDKRIVTVKGKGSKERLVPVSKNAIKIVLEYVNNERKYFLAKSKQNNWLFPSKTSKSGYVTRYTFFKNLKQLAAIAELNPKIISPHTLRHSFATNLINHDADLRSVQKMLGHENIATTEIYTHIIKEKLVETVLQKHPLAGIKFKDD